MERLQLVSVIITTKNEEMVLNDLLRSIKHQKYRSIEVIVIDNNSSDNTKEVAKLFTDKVFNWGPERSGQRNYGAKIAKGKFLLILDADMILTPRVIKECVDMMNQDMGIGGVIIPEESIFSNFWGSVKAFERSFYNEEGDSFTDAARFFRRELFWKVGGYDEKITGPEDWDLPENIRDLGCKLGRIKAKIIHRERVRSPIDIALKKFYYAMSSGKYLSKHKIPLIGPKTIFFLRPVFYKQWKKLVLHPMLSAGMIIMLTCEQIGGGLGFFYGRYFHNEVAK